jgi:hypothetical protein
LSRISFTRRHSTLPLRATSTVRRGTGRPVSQMVQIGGHSSSTEQLTTRAIHPLSYWNLCAFRGSSAKVRRQRHSTTIIITTLPACIYLRPDPRRFEYSSFVDVALFDVLCRLSNSHDDAPASSQWLFQWISSWEHIRYFSSQVSQWLGKCNVNKTGRDWRILRC